MPRHQRKHASSNTAVGRDFEKIVYKHFSIEYPDLKQPFRLEIGYYKKKEHRYDLGSHSGKVMIECKSHTWTEGGNLPSAKMTVWDQAMLYFYLAPRSYRKIMAVKKDFSEKRGVTLCQYYIRTHEHVIPDEVEFWEFDEDTGKGNRVEFDLTKGLLVKE